MGQHGSGDFPWVASWYQLTCLNENNSVLHCHRANEHVKCFTVLQPHCIPSARPVWDCLENVFPEEQGDMAWSGVVRGRALASQPACPEGLSAPASGPGCGLSVQWNRQEQVPGRSDLTSHLMQAM